MAGRVEAQLDPVVIDDLAVFQGLEIDVGTQPGAQDAGAAGGGEIVAVATRAWSPWPWVMTERSTGCQGSM